MYGMRQLILGSLLFGTALASGLAVNRVDLLFPSADSTLRQSIANPVPLIVDVDFSKVKSFRHGAPRILITFTGAQQNNFGFELNALDSRPLRIGEKSHWEGKISKGAAYLVRVVDGTSASVVASKVGNTPIKIVLTADAKGQWGLSEGNCAPRTVGACSGSSPK